MQKKIGVISLGCDKNRVDTEKMLGALDARFQLVNDLDNADALIINTCAFLASARLEAITEILQAIKLKEQGKLQKIIVTGCLPQKFVYELDKELSLVDAFMGISDYANINSVLDSVFNGERVILDNLPKNEDLTKRVLTTNGYAYLKIADGCSNHCTYCLIPKIRGAYRSIQPCKIIEEVVALGEIKELILVAQDTARYGYDLTPKTTLTALIKELSKLDNIKSIRLLYCYPENITEELINELATNEKLIKYIDMPLQHADDKILKLMNRKGTKKGYLELIERLRNRVDGIAIRSTFIAGFPQESQDAFNNLLEFIKDAKLNSAGFFAYSKEEDTPAYKLDGHLPESIKKQRVKKLYSAQKAVSKQINKGYIGKTIKVIAEGFDSEQLIYYGRAKFFAPDIDGKVYFFSGEEVVYGEELDILVVKSSYYDLFGERV